MTIEELKERLISEEEMLKKLELSFHQTAGRISILKDLINFENKRNEEGK